MGQQTQKVIRSWIANTLHKDEIGGCSRDRARQTANPTRTTYIACQRHHMRSGIAAHARVPLLETVFEVRYANVIRSDVSHGHWVLGGD